MCAARFGSKQVMRTILEHLHHLELDDYFLRQRNRRGLTALELARVENLDCAKVITKHLISFGHHPQAGKICLEFTSFDQVTPMRAPTNFAVLFQSSRARLLTTNCWLRATYLIISATTEIPQLQQPTRCWMIQRASSRPEPTSWPTRTKLERWAGERVVSTTRASRPMLQPSTIQKRPSSISTCWSNKTLVALTSQLWPLDRAEVEQVPMKTITLDSDHKPALWRAPDHASWDRAKVMVAQVVPVRAPPSRRASSAKALQVGRPVGAGQAERRAELTDPRSRWAQVTGSRAGETRLPRHSHWLFHANLSSAFNKTWRRLNVRLMPPQSAA